MAHATSLRRALGAITVALVLGAPHATGVVIAHDPSEASIASFLDRGTSFGLERPDGSLRVFMVVRYVPLGSLPPRRARAAAPTEGPPTVDVTADGLASTFRCDVPDFVRLARDDVDASAFLLALHERCRAIAGGERARADLHATPPSPWSRPFERFDPRPVRSASASVAPDRAPYLYYVDVTRAYGDAAGWLSPPPTPNGRPGTE